jgi:hypothetical protein
LLLLFDSITLVILVFFSNRHLTILTQAEEAFRAGGTMTLADVEFSDDDESGLLLNNKTLVGVVVGVFANKFEFYDFSLLFSIDFVRECTTFANNEFRCRFSRDQRR